MEVYRIILRYRIVGAIRVVSLGLELFSEFLTPPLHVSVLLLILYTQKVRPSNADNVPANDTAVCDTDRCRVSMYHTRHRCRIQCLIPGLRHRCHVYFVYGFPDTGVVCKDDTGVVSSRTGWQKNAVDETTLDRRFRLRKPID